MIFEILGKGIYIEHRKKNGRNIKLTISEDLKTTIYLSLTDGLTEGAIIGYRKAIVGWWRVKNIYKNPLLIK